jgi:ribosome-associated heat shock protein Hsp15
MNAQETASTPAVRIDRYIWAIRITKTRSLAAALCRGGHVKIAETSAKPSHVVRIGDRILINYDQRNFDIEVTKLITSRVGADIAVTCYIDHSPRAERSPKVAAAFAREPSTGRPTKRERRLLDRLRQGR